MRIGGWKTDSVFERYHIIDEADLRDAVVKLETSQKENSQRKRQNGGSDDSVRVGGYPIQLQQPRYNQLNRYDVPVKKSHGPDGETGRRTGLKIPGP
jgi:hypothetical protein